MPLLQGKQIKQSFGARQLFEIEELAIHAGDKIGLVGVNGAGKTTLLQLLAGKRSLESGTLTLDSQTTIAYISQLGLPNATTLNGKSASLFHVSPHWNDTMSGGEKTRFKLAEGFAEKPSLLLVDEPTNHLDLEGIALITTLFQSQSGSYVVISHDRAFLDQVCTKIWEIDQGRLFVYQGNYSHYRKQKENLQKRAEFEYQSFQKEKSRLLEAQQQVKTKSSQTKTTPSRMGNSEARLHKMGGQTAKKRLDHTAKALEKRINQLEEKNAPIKQDVIRIQLPESSKSHSKILFSAEDLQRKFGQQSVLEHTNFQFVNGKKVALLGPNGSGKTTLVRSVLQGVDVTVSPSVRIGYLSQSMEILEEEKNTMENVMENSVHREEFARLILARLLLKEDQIYQPLNVLSGGERVKVAFAKLLLGNYNLLVLDEPTNYLDVASLEVIEELLVHYDGSLLFVSHDRQLMEKVATELWILENRQVTIFPGTYEEYLHSQEQKNAPKKRNVTQQKMLLEMELSSLLGQLATTEDGVEKEKLDQLYWKKQKELQQLEL